jgi:hypothetical protein
MDEAGMIDLVAAITLTALAVTSTGALILASPVEGARLRLSAVAALWFAAVTVLAAAGVFANIPALGVAVIGPVLIGAIAAFRVSSVRALALGVPLALLVGVHVGRLLGGFFLALHADGRLPATFALSAGWGDIAIAALAVPIAWMAARRMPYWRSATLLWNTLGFIDLVAAVTLGFGSAPGSPLRFIYEESVPGTLATLPWFLIPGFLVPIYLLSHLAVFARLAAAARTSALSSLAVHLGRS